MGLEARLKGLAVAAARGDQTAADQLAEGMAALAAAPRADFMVFDAFLREDGSDAAVLRRLAGPFPDAIAAHPESYPQKVGAARSLVSS